LYWHRRRGGCYRRGSGWLYRFCRGLRRFRCRLAGHRLRWGGGRGRLVGRRWRGLAGGEFCFQLGDPRIALRLCHRLSGGRRRRGWGGWRGWRWLRKRGLHCGDFFRCWHRRPGWLGRNSGRRRCSNAIHTPVEVDHVVVYQLTQHLIRTALVNVDDVADMGSIHLELGVTRGFPA
jgi:hypothetical protein